MWQIIHGSYTSCEVCDTWKLQQDTYWKYLFLQNNMSYAGMHQVYVKWWQVACINYSDSDCNNENAKKVFSINYWMEIILEYELNKCQIIFGNPKGDKGTI